MSACGIVLDVHGSIETAAQTVEVSVCESKRLMKFLTSIELGCKRKSGDGDNIVFTSGRTVPSSGESHQVGELRCGFSFMRINCSIVVVNGKTWGSRLISATLDCGGWVHLVMRQLFSQERKFL